MNIEFRDVHSVKHELEELLFEEDESWITQHAVWHDSTTLVVAARHSGQMVGFMLLEDGYIWLALVRSAFRRQGIMRQMVKAALDAHDMLSGDCTMDMARVWSAVGATLKQGTGKLGCEHEFCLKRHNDQG
jgi:GNAT superfamily N-acetyltransferase